MPWQWFSLRPEFQRLDDEFEQGLAEAAARMAPVRHEMPSAWNQIRAPHITLTPCKTPGLYIISGAPPASGAEE